MRHQTDHSVIVKFFFCSRLSKVHITQSEGILPARYIRLKIVVIRFRPSSFSEATRLIVCCHAQCLHRFWSVCFILSLVILEPSLSISSGCKGILERVSLKGFLIRYFHCFSFSWISACISLIEFGMPRHITFPPVNSLTFWHTLKRSCFCEAFISLHFSGAFFPFFTVFVPNSFWYSCFLLFNIFQLIYSWFFILICNRFLFLLVPSGDH